MRKFHLFAAVFLVLACTISCTELNSQEKIDAFTKWLDDNGFHRTFDIKEIPGQGLGGIARKNIEAGESLLKVPKSKLVYANDQSNINGWSDWANDKIDPLVIFILRERLNPNSEWKPYLDILPENFDEHPYFWTDDDLAFCKNNSIVHRRLQALQVLDKMYNHLLKNLVEEQPELFPEGYFTWERYLWAFLCVTTRAWSSKLLNDDYVLVPLADMLNHKPTASEGDLNAFNQFEINSTQVYAPGEQVYDSYGQKTSFQLLMYYGFVPDSYNPYEGAMFEFFLKVETNSLHKKIHELLSAHHEANNEPGTYHSLTLSIREIPHKLLRVFRMLAMTSLDDEDTVASLLEYRAISLDNEKLAFRSAINSLEGILAQYPPAEEDLKNVEDPTLNHNKRTAIRLRINEREVYEKTIATIKSLWQQILVKGELIGGLKF